ncbi:MAG: glycosyltransferase family 2 protein [Chloroflexi bacterium]|nr:glycosyltransferase family 2 protein [Chloroflexota bacterium]
MTQPQVAPVHPTAAPAVPRVAVIIPNWNGAHLLPTCLDALRCQVYRDFQTVVVDNGSQDGSRELLARAYPEVRGIPLPTNLFFSGAVNCGIRDTASPIIVLLNNDTEPEPRWLEELVAGLEAHPEAGMATSKILLFDRRDTLHTAGDFYTLDGVPGNRGVWERDTGQYDGATRVFGACAGAAAYRRAMLDDIGLFDEDFVGYCEDVDLSFRAQLAGYSCVYVPTARVYHRLSATGGGPLASYLCGRNFINVIVKNVPASLLRRYWWRMARGQCRLTLEALRHWREPAARARIRGQLAALLAIPTMLVKRREIQARRRVDDRTIEALLRSGL